MRNLIISYPNISPSDYDRIQDIRKAHDPMYFDVVRPHVTIVFGTEKLDPKGLREHAERRLAGARKIALVLDRAMVVEDDSGTFFHTFLVPSEGSEGYDGINTLHDNLYTDELTSELRDDIPFIPHVGIGTSTSKAEMDALAAELNGQGVSIHGSLDDLSIVQYDGKKVVDVDKVELA